jgi:hypothetical protein
MTESTEVTPSTEPQVEAAARMRDNLAERIGLSRATVDELLSRGWRYVDDLGRVPVWEHPMWSLAAEGSE